MNFKPSTSSAVRSQHAGADQEEIQNTQTLNSLILRKQTSHSGTRYRPQNATSKPLSDIQTNILAFDWPIQCRQGLRMITSKRLKTTSVK